jgi:hypothetical protein
MSLAAFQTYLENMISTGQTSDMLLHDKSVTNRMLVHSLITEIGANDMIRLCFQEESRKYHYVADITVSRHAIDPAVIMCDKWEEGFLVTVGEALDEFFLEVDEEDNKEGDIEGR